MDIQQKDDGRNGVFFIPANNELLAEITYRISEDLIIIDRTEVDATLEGKGGGKQLVNAAVEFAREKQINILPHCSFVKHVFDLIFQYNDVLK